MKLVCLDLEGVLVPEIWINFARDTGLEELKMTTRDEPDYSVLMKKRLAILKREGLTLTDISESHWGYGPSAGGNRIHERTTQPDPGNNTVRYL
jgi:phosphoserine/homoserine phosphotransferase